MATRPVRMQRREGRRITRYEPEFEQTRYDLRESSGGAGRRHYGPHDYEEQDRGGGRYYAKRMPSPTRVGRRRARSPSPDVYRETARRRRERPADKRAAAEEEYEAHPLDEFDRYMLAKRRRGRAREHMRPAAREMERIAYPTGTAGLRRRGRREEEEEEEPESEHYPSEEEEESEEYERFRERRRLAGYGEERRGRQMTRRRDLVAGRRGREEEDEGGEEGYEYYYSPEEEEEGEGEGYTEEEEGEGLMSAPEELDEDEEFITGRRRPIRRRGADYGRGGRGETTQRFEKRGAEEEEEEKRAGGRGRKRGREEEREEEPQGRRGRKLSARKTHRHPSYEDMIAEALVKVGKNGKASGVAIFKYIHDHFDTPANDRLVRNHLHQAFERLIDDGKLRHKKASYVLPRNLLTEYGAKYSGAKEETQQKAGEKNEGEDQQGAPKEKEQYQTVAGGEQPSEEKGTEGEGTTSKKGASGRKKSR